MISQVPLHHHHNHLLRPGHRHLSTMTVSYHSDMTNYANAILEMQAGGAVASGCDLIKTESPNIYCTAIPSHWRSNKSLPNNFRVIVFDDVKDGTIATIRVGNDENHCGELRNNSAPIKDNVALFNDLRFIGRSGRGKCFCLSIVINSSPMIMTTLTKCIKITVDGPREPRNKARHQSWPYPLGLHPLVGGYVMAGSIEQQQLAAVMDLARVNGNGSSWLEMCHFLSAAAAAGGGGVGQPLPTSALPSLHPHHPSFLQAAAAGQQHHQRYQQQQQMMAAIAGLTEAQRITAMGLEGRCHRCAGCGNGGLCTNVNRSPPVAPLPPSNASTTSSNSSSPPHTPSPLSRTSPSSSTTPTRGGASSVLSGHPSNNLHHRQISPTVSPNQLNLASILRNGIPGGHPSFSGFASVIPHGLQGNLPSNLAGSSPVSLPNSIPGNLANSLPCPVGTTSKASSLSAFSIPKHSQRNSVDSSRALQMAAVDSTNCSSPKTTSSTPDGCDSSKDLNCSSNSTSSSSCNSSNINNNSIDVNSSNVSVKVQSEENDGSVSRNVGRESGFRPLKGSASRSTNNKVWRPY